jgi:hypothetical protein
MVELRSVNADSEEISVTAPMGPATATNPLPTATKAMVEKQDVWYRKFSRNIHGLRKDKPYNNLQWPPTAPPPN